MDHAAVARGGTGPAPIPLPSHCGLGWRYAANRPTDAAPLLPPACRVTWLQRIAVLLKPPPKRYLGLLLRHGPHLPCVFQRHKSLLLSLPWLQGDGSAGQRSTLVRSFLSAFSAQSGILERHFVHPLCQHNTIIQRPSTHTILLCSTPPHDSTGADRSSTRHCK